MLPHPNISLELGVDYQDLAHTISYGEMIFTGPIDAYFNYCYGKLPYRSLEFRHETHDRRVYQKAPVINFPNEHKYTRTTEFKYLTGQEHSKTSIVYEYPCAVGDAYYPIPTSENAELYKKYQKLADLIPNVHFAGRLGTYKYYNMDQVVGQALTLASKILGYEKNEIFSYAR
jgi:UDP-galactopyranose mutase